MHDLLRKEMVLSASALSYLFITFGLMFFLPGYPVLCGAFLVTLGIFQTFQYAREANDTVFSALLPVAKQDVVKARYLFVCLIELCASVLMAAAVAVRMTVLAGAAAYLGNSLMNANLFALGAAFLVFGLFNLIFVGGFYRTAYSFGRPFLLYCIAVMFVIFAAEALHHFPGLEALNAFGTDHLTMQFCLLAAGVALYVIMTVSSCRTACRNFERTDL